MVCARMSLASCFLGASDPASFLSGRNNQIPKSVRILTTAPLLPSSRLTTSVSVGDDRGTADNEATDPPAMYVYMCIYNRVFLQLRDSYHHLQPDRSISSVYPSELLERAEVGWPVCWSRAPSVFRTCSSRSIAGRPRDGSLYRDGGKDGTRPAVLRPKLRRRDRGQDGAGPVDVQPAQRREGHSNRHPRRRRRRRGRATRAADRGRGACGTGVRS